jgi:hypothetical protein
MPSGSEHIEAEALLPATAFALWFVAVGAVIAAGVVGVM